VKIGRRRRMRGQIRHEPLLEAEGGAAVIVIAANATEFAIAALAVARDRGVVGYVHFEADGAAAAGDCGSFRDGEQHWRDPASTHMGRDRNGIEARNERARPEQNDRSARELVVMLGDDHLCGWRL